VTPSPFLNHSTAAEFARILGAPPGILASSGTISSIRNWPSTPRHGCRLQSSQETPSLAAITPGVDAMTRARLAVLTCFLLLPCSLHAQFPSSLTPQQRPPASTNPTARVRGWYRQFFNREMDRGALRWINDLQRGLDPNQVLAQILSSDEYYQLAGSTPEGFVRQLFDDLRGREPTRDELRDWTRRLQTLKREQVALALIREGPGPQPPTPPADADYFAELEDAIRRVGDKLEDLSDDIVDELEGKRERELVRRTEAVTDELRAFQRVARPG